MKYTLNDSDIILENMDEVHSIYYDKTKNGLDLFGIRYAKVCATFPSGCMGV